MLSNVIDHARRLLLCLYAIAVLLAIFQQTAPLLGFEAMTGDGIVSRRPPSLFGNPNALALQMVLAICLVMARPGPSNAILIAWFALGLALTLSMGGLLAMGMTTLILMSYSQRGRAVIPWLLLAGVGLAGLMFTLRPLAAFVESAHSRVGLYYVAVRGIALKPWLGWGAGGYRRVWELYHDAYAFIPKFRPIHAHDLYLQVAVIAGLPAALLLLASITCYAYCARHRPALAAALLAVMVNGLVDYHLAYSIALVTTLATIGVIHAAGYQSFVVVDRRGADRDPDLLYLPG